MTILRTKNLPQLAALAVVLGAACAPTKDFVWVDKAPPSQVQEEQGYLISVGDVVGVRVWNHDANSVDRARVREDGKISMPFLNDVAVAGLEPPLLARMLEEKLKSFIKDPAVTVVVHERRPLRVSVLGKTARPGVYDLDPGAGVLQALAAAGGLTVFADEDGVFVLRGGSASAAPLRIRFKYADLRAGRIPAGVFKLRPGDIVVVE